METNRFGSEPLMTADAVMGYLGLSRSNTYRLLRNGTIPSVRIGNSIRVVRSELMAWLEKTAGPREVA